MANILDLAKRNIKALEASSESLLRMESGENLSPRDIAITAAVIMPATAVWILSERAWPAIMIGALIFLGIQYGATTVRVAREIDFQPLFRTLARAYSYARALVRSRAARRA